MPTSTPPTVPASKTTSFNAFMKKSIAFIIAACFAGCFSILFVDKLITVMFPGAHHLWTNPLVFLAMGFVGYTAYCFSKHELNDILKGDGGHEHGSSTTDTLAELVDDYQTYRQGRWKAWGALRSKPESAHASMPTDDAHSIQRHTSSEAESNSPEGMSTTMKGVAALIGGFLCYSYFSEWHGAIDNALIHWSKAFGEQLPLRMDVIAYIAMAGIFCIAFSKLNQCVELFQKNQNTATHQGRESQDQKTKNTKKILSSLAIFFTCALTSILQPALMAPAALCTLAALAWIHQDKLKQKKGLYSALAVLMLALHAVGEAFIPSQGIYSATGSWMAVVGVFLLTCISEIIIDAPTTIRENEETEPEKPAQNEKAAEKKGRPLIRTLGNILDIATYPVFLMAKIISHIAHNWGVSKQGRDAIKHDIKGFMAFSTAAAMALLGAMECMQYEQLTLNFSSLAHVGNIFLIVAIVVSGIAVETALFKEAIDGVGEHGEGCHHGHGAHAHHAGLKEEAVAGASESLLLDWLFLDDTDHEVKEGQEGESAANVTV